MFAYSHSNRQTEFHRKKLWVIEILAAGLRSALNLLTFIEVLEDVDAKKRGKVYVYRK